MGKEKIQRHRIKVLQLLSASGLIKISRVPVVRHGSAPLCKLPQLLSASDLIKISGGSDKARLNQARQALPSALPQVLSTTSQLRQAPSRRCSPQLRKFLCLTSQVTCKCFPQLHNSLPQVLSVNINRCAARGERSHTTRSMCFRVYEELIS